jgi:hypothetical protein
MRQRQQTYGMEDFILPATITRQYYLKPYGMLTIWLYDDTDINEYIFYLKQLSINTI